ncbi:DUF1876 domain-containing protein [Georgenia yuyongxinii]|uniref:DUF1876 domain-containing protein n=1 Tax=Georgenia yuyongxinii TaxID=2589797 RepID=A0A552WRM1_9MICO|nr:dsRBD fold-containing protein [Georgenia yuyongxinii]QDC23682.1 DUF1876 domain-containing protein [Georgenia yuyongxinii]TRW45374.1 DUF1876 domain-containing protein [Georgenia yuyongxinii]
MAHTWTVKIELFTADEVRSDDPITTAHATLTTTQGGSLDGYGRARLNPDDQDVPEIGEELAAARALRDLADRLLRTTSDDIAAVEHHKVHLHS